MKILTAEFVKSCSAPSQTPNSDGRPEYAFIGRSNVGKSTLINMLTGKKGLAKTSQKPGKTQLLNYFNINDSFYIVDLPGYGYAKTPKNIREGFRKLIEGYILGSEDLTNLFILIDCRHEPQKIDLAFIEQMGEHGIPFSLVFTKSDKLSESRLQQNIEEYKNELLKSWEDLPPIFITSGEKQRGADELLEYIEEINLSIKQK
ncbi:MAG: ribosome biogenesis GTP-binding protein YihA/YsxC [Porphyromonas sp.]|nr:ribosome biogenesis GTP-binding protein YihA/YsxC [Porphyromonas sp.]